MSVSDEKFCPWCIKTTITCSDPYDCIMDNESCENLNQALWNAQEEIARLQAELDQRQWVSADKPPTKDLQCVVETSEGSYTSIEVCWYDHSKGHGFDADDPVLRWCDCIPPLPSNKPPTTEGSES